jgi:hypothetical protein
VYLKNMSTAPLLLKIVPFIEEIGSSQALWTNAYMEITWENGTQTIGRYSLEAWKNNTTLELAPQLNPQQESGPYLVKFDIPSAAGDEIAGANITFNLVFDGIQAGVRIDADSDGYFSSATGGDDCDDTKADVNPGAEEICGNQIDDNCDGQVDESCPWINEIHYDNAGVDQNEGVEIAGKAGTDLTSWKIIPYNGSNGASYTPILDLSGIIPDQQNSFGTLWFPLVGMQNGPSDGLALVSPSNVVIKFLSYEGTFMATNESAAGMTSIDIGVYEPGSDMPDWSLQLQGIGNKYADFTWTSPSPNTRGAVNMSQVFN